MLCGHRSVDGISLLPEELHRSHQPPPSRHLHPELGGRCLREEIQGSHEDPAIAVLCYLYLLRRSWCCLRLLRRMGLLLLLLVSGSMAIRQRGGLDRRLDLFVRPPDQVLPSCGHGVVGGARGYGHRVQRGENLEGEPDAGARRRVVGRQLDASPLRDQRLQRWHDRRRGDPAAADGGRRGSEEGGGIRRGRVL